MYDHPLSVQITHIQVTTQSLLSEISMWRDEQQQYANVIVDTANEFPSFGRSLGIAVATSIETAGYELPLPGNSPFSMKDYLQAAMHNWQNTTWNAYQHYYDLLVALNSKATAWAALDDAEVHATLPNPPTNVPGGGLGN